MPATPLCVTPAGSGCGPATPQSCPCCEVPTHALPPTPPPTLPPACVQDALSHVDDVGKQIAMHAAGLRPLYLSQDQVPEDVLERERNTLRLQVGRCLGVGLQVVCVPVCVCICGWVWVWVWEWVWVWVRLCSMQARW